MDYLPDYNLLREDYESMINDFKNQARIYVERSIKFYLKLDYIDKDSYTQIIIETRSLALADLMIQLKIANETVREIYIDIQSSESINNRTIEVLTGLQRLILDIVKFQMEYFKKMDSSFLQLKDINELTNDIGDDDKIKSYTMGEIMGELDKHMANNDHDKYLKTSKNPKLSGIESQEETPDDIKIQKIEEYED